MKIETRMAIWVWAVLSVALGGCGRTGMDDPSGAADPVPPAPKRLSAFERDGRWGFRDDCGDIVIEPRFDMALDFGLQEIGFAVAQGRWVALDRQGKVLHRVWVVDNGPDPFVEGVARFIDAGKMGFFDRHGTTVIAPRFDFVFPFAEGRAAACVACESVSDGEYHRFLGGDWGYIDHDGNWAIPPTFDSASSFRDGVAEVTRDGRTFRIDPSGGSAP